MKHKTKLSVLLAVAATTPAIVAPRLVAPAQAQAKFGDVDPGHWAYTALNRLSAAGIVEGVPPKGNYEGTRPMTRYEFAVAIARLLDGIPTLPPPRPDTPGVDLSGIQGDIRTLQARPIPDINRAQVNALIEALRREFQDELARLGARVDVLDARTTALENRVNTPPRLTIAPSILHRTGTTNYINNSVGAGIVGGPGSGGAPFPTPRNPSNGQDFSNKKFSYTDFELRLTDRVSDRLSLNAAVRSLTGNQEDAWANSGALAGGNGIYIREAFASADLSDRSFLAIRGLSTTLGRQRTQFAQGLLYNNELQPTDQIRADFNLGPVALTSFFGSNNNLAGSYTGQAALAWAAANGIAGTAQGGFPVIGAAGIVGDDNEAGLHGALNLFRISGQPVRVGGTLLFDTYQRQEGRSLDVSLPLFNRTIGIEYVRQNRLAVGTKVGNNAYNVTLPVFRSNALDLDVAYGKADNGFEYYAVSSANPYARSYGEAIFDRPLALGAPLIGAAGYTAVKQAFDVNGTVRLPLGFLRRYPLDFRYYTADGVNGGIRVDLGKVYSLGTTLNLTPGLDLELKGGVYDPDVAGLTDIRYFRAGMTLGF